MMLRGTIPPVDTLEISRERLVHTVGTVDDIESVTGVGKHSTASDIINSCRT